MSSLFGAVCVESLVVVELPPPCRHRGRATAQFFSAPAAPTRSAGHVRVPRGSVASLERRERRGRSMRPRCSCSGGSVPRQLRQAGSPGGGEPPWHRRSSWSRQGPSCSRWLDANCMGTSPVLHARAGLEAMLSPPLTPSQLKEDQLLRGFGRAERVDRRGRKLALPAGVLGRISVASELLGGFEAMLVACDS